MLDVSLMMSKKSAPNVIVDAPTLIYPPASYTTATNFGVTIEESTDGVLLAIGATMATVGGVANNGVVHLYDAGTLEYKATIQPTTTVSNQYFGTAIYITKDRSKIYVAANGWYASGFYGRIYVFTKGASDFVYTQTTYMTGTVAGEGFGASVEVSESKGYLYSGKPTTNTNQGSVDRWTYPGHTRNAQQGLGAPAANDYFGQQIAVSEPLDVLFVGVPQLAASTAKNGFVYPLATSGAALTSNNILPMNASPSTNVGFGNRMDISPSGLKLAVGSTTYRAGNTAGGAPCGAFEFLSFSRSGATLNMVREGVLDFSAYASGSGNVRARWLDDDVVMLGHLGVTVGGAADAGAIMLAVKNGSKFEFLNKENPFLPTPGDQAPVASRNYGVSMCGSSVHKRLYAGAIRDTNGSGQPTGRVLVWNYQK